MKDKTIEQLAKTAEQIVTEKFNGYKESKKSFKQLAIDSCVEFANQQAQQEPKWVSVEEELPNQLQVATSPNGSQK